MELVEIGVKRAQEGLPRGDGWEKLHGFQIRNTQNSHFCAWSLVILEITTLQFPCHKEKKRNKKGEVIF